MSLFSNKHDSLLTNQVRVNKSVNKPKLTGYHNILASS